MTSVRGLRIFVTGGARGIGRGLLRHFLQAGHFVYILDANRAELDHVRTLADQWNHGAKRWKAVECDLQDRRKIKDIVQDLSNFFEGQLDVLINNAFATPHTWSNGRGMEDDEDSIADEWDRKIAVGLTAPFLLSRLCVPLLKRGKSADDSPGTIINISSTRAYQAELNHEAYSAAKAGLLGLTQSMAVSLGDRHAIRVNAIIPGWISVDNENAEADRQNTAWEDGFGKEDNKWHPAGRVGKVEDIARAVEFLATSSFITGQEIVVDGGVGRKMVYPE